MLGSAWTIFRQPIGSAHSPYPISNHILSLYSQVNVNPAYRVSELEYALRKVGCKALVMAESFKTQDYYDMVFELCPELASMPPGHLKSHL